MPKSPRMTVQILTVLTALLDGAAADTELYGLDIAERAGLLPSTTYAILAKLRALGWVRDRWEGVDPQREHRPRRRYHALTPEGRGKAEEALKTAKRRLETLTSRLQ